MRTPDDQRVEPVEENIAPTEPVKKRQRGNGAEPPQSELELDTGAATTSEEPIEEVVAAEEPAERTPDVYDDLDKMRINPLRDQIATKTTVHHVTVRRPRPTEWIRAHPTLEIDIYGIEDPLTNEHHIVDPNPGLRQLLSALIRVTKLVPCINRQGTVFLWAIKMPTDRGNPWAETSLMALADARKGWTRVASNRDAGGYETVTPIDPLREPVWPENKTMTDYLRLGYGRHKYIRDADHDFVKEYLGRIR
jgi:hypothetical protein